MAKYNEKLVTKIIRLIESDIYSISEICDTLNISRKTFYEWNETKPEFRKEVEKATERRDEALLTTARSSMKRKLEGYTLTEERITYIPDEQNERQLKIKSKVLKIKEFAPDTQAIRVVLEHTDRKSNRNEISNSAPFTINVLGRESKERLEILMNNKGQPGGKLR